MFLKVHFLGGHYNIHSVMSLLKREYGREDSDKLRREFSIEYLFVKLLTISF
jgi:hypothetical protein